MNDAQIDELVDELEAVNWVRLRQRLKRLNQRDRAGTVIPDGYSSRTINGDIPAKDPESLTPTERAADARAYGRPQRDPVHEANVHALAALGQAVSAVDGMVNHLCRADELQRYEKPAGHQAPQCRAEGCDGPAVARGWCDPCRKWISRNPTADGLDPVTVPASVIGERSKRREKVA